MVITKTFDVSTEGNCDILDITTYVSKTLSECKVKDGTVTLFVPGSTAGLTTIEYEPGLISDLKEMWQRLIPENLDYKHDSRWGDGNGHAHLRASLLDASLVIPFRNRNLILGTWQQIVLVDFDNAPRKRQLIIQIMGE